MGSGHSTAVATGIVNELIDHFSFLDSEKMFVLNSFKVSSIKSSSYHKYQGVQNITKFVKDNIDGNMSWVDTMNDEEYYQIYMARRLMCLFFDLPFTEPQYRSFMEWDLERNYFTRQENKSKFDNVAQAFKTQFYKTKEGTISPDTDDENIINALKAKLMLVISTLLEKHHASIKTIAHDASNSLNLRKKEAKDAQTKAFASVFEK